MATYKTSLLTRKALLNSAGELFAEFGYDAVTTRAIARKAHANIGNIHYHFGNKMGLLSALFDNTLIETFNKKIRAHWDEVKDHLDSPEAQQQWVRTLIYTYRDFAFAPDRPKWISPLTFQILERNWEISDKVFDVCVRPIMDIFVTTYRVVSGSDNVMHARLWMLSACAPIMIYATNPNAVGLAVHDQSFISLRQAIVDYSVRSALLSLGLPPLLEHENLHENGTVEKKQKKTIPNNKVKK